MADIEIFSEYKPFSFSKDDYVILASKVGDGVVNFSDSLSETIMQKRIQWEETCLIENCSDELLKKGIKVLIKEIKRRRKQRKEKAR